MLLDYEDLKQIGALRRAGRLDEAEARLRAAEPSPATLDELRKVASVRASAAKKAGDWSAVVQYLEGYIADADRARAHCLQIVKAEPPPLSEREQALLQEAKAHL
jgi:hypothetical protein